MFNRPSEWAARKYDFGSDGMRRDTDGDRLDDSAEYAYGTDPAHRDTDMDGLTATRQK